MKGIKTQLLGLALSSVIGNAWAEEFCARVQDLTALQVAAVQQKLMVGAYACDAPDLYNAFVVTYRQDLQDSDRALQDFFMRLNARTGGSDYHAYKTKLANAHSLRSAQDIGAYCGLMRASFHAALDEGTRTLAEFALAQPVTFLATYNACGERVVGAVALVAQKAMAETPAAAVPAPRQELPASNPAASYAPSRDSYRSNAQQPRIRRYEARSRYDRAPYTRIYNGRSYDYSSPYDGRDLYYRDPYDRYRQDSRRQYYYPGRR